MPRSSRVSKCPLTFLTISSVVGGANVYVGYLHLLWGSPLVLLCVAGTLVCIREARRQRALTYRLVTAPSVPRSILWLAAAGTYPLCWLLGVV